MLLFDYYIAKLRYNNRACIELGQEKRISEL